MGGRYAVVQVRGKYSVLYHIRLLAGDALVVKVEGSAVGLQGSVVYDLDAFGADLFAHLVCKDGGSLAVEIGLEGVAHGLVQENAGSSGAHYDGHPAAFRAFGGKAVVYAFDHLFGHFLCQFFGEHFGPAAEAPGGGFVLRHFSLAEDHRERDAAHRAGVPFELFLGVVHQDVAHLEGEVHHHFHDAAVAASHIGLQLLQEGEEGAHRGAAPGLEDGVAVCVGVGFPAAGIAGAVGTDVRGAAGNLRRRPGR